MMLGIGHDTIGTSQVHAFEVYVDLELFKIARELFWSDGKMRIIYIYIYKPVRTFIRKHIIIFSIEWSRCLFTGRGGVWGMEIDLFFTFFSMCHYLKEQITNLSSL